MDSTNIYAYISIIALLVCIPPAILVSMKALMPLEISTYKTILKILTIQFIKSLLICVTFAFAGRGTSTDQAWL